MHAVRLPRRIGLDTIPQPAIPASVEKRMSAAIVAADLRTLWPAAIWCCTFSPGTDGAGMLISPAYAQGAGAGGGDFLVSLLPLVLIFVVFYFLLIRPQQKKVKDHKALVAALRRGDRVVTAGGFYATVTKVVSDTEVELELAQGVKVRAVRGTITEVLSKTAPSPGRPSKTEREIESEAEEDPVETAPDDKSRPNG